MAHGSFLVLVRAPLAQGLRVMLYAVLLRFGASLHFGHFGQRVDRSGSFQAKCCIFLDFGPIVDLRPQKVAHDPGASFEHIRSGNGQLSKWWGGRLVFFFSL